MKTLNLTKYKTKLLRLKLLKTKIYKNQKNFDYLLLEDIETRLKKILRIIYQFHVANKKILFIGTSLQLKNQMRRFLKGKKHSFIPKNVWIDGVITNPEPSFKHLLKRYAINSDKTLKFLFNLRDQVDLIVVLDETVNLTPLKESSLKRIPTISLDSDYNLSNSNLSTYKIIGDSSFAEEKVQNSFFFLLLNSLFKKAEIVRKKQFNKKSKQLKAIKQKWNQFKYK